MTYRLTMVVDRPVLPLGDPQRRITIVTKIAGCVDVAEAKRKAQRIYFVVEFKKVEPVNE